MKITYFGWPGHFCCAHDCVFHLNTLVEYHGKAVIVSTVGHMRDPLNRGEIVEVCSGRFYETAVFFAHQITADNGKVYWEIDPSKQISVESKCGWSDVMDDDKANDGHHTVLEEVCEKLKDGLI